MGSNVRLEVIVDGPLSSTHSGAFEKVPCDFFRKIAEARRRKPISIATIRLKGDFVAVEGLEGFSFLLPVFAQGFKNVRLPFSIETDPSLVDKPSIYKKVEDSVDIKVLDGNQCYLVRTLAYNK